MPCPGDDSLPHRRGRRTVIEGVVRRAQFVAPFGPGAMQVLSDGTSVITAGLDHWFASDSGAHVDIEAFRVHEWRLEKDLGVSRLLLPPDYRRRRAGQDDTNTNLNVPVLRFPTWSFCPRCRRLFKHALHRVDKPRCPDCERATTAKRSPFLAQVPFVSMCERGHLQDFPWSEWVHEAINPTCVRPRKLKLTTSGGGTLASQRLECEECHKSRPLTGITSTLRDQQNDQDSTVLTLTLEKGAEYTCRGGAPWLGLEDSAKPCPSAVRATLRGASNVYYALVRSSIFVPSVETGSADPNLLSLLTDPQSPIKSALDTLLEIFQGSLPNAEQLRKAAKSNSKVLKSYSDEQLTDAISVAISSVDAAPPGSEDGAASRSLREEEHASLRGTIESPDLVVREAEEAYAASLTDVISRVRLVEKLRETRALWGFNRVFAESEREDHEGRAALLRRHPVPAEDSWLPACTVLGEGIFLELNPERLAAWENNGDVAARVSLVGRRFQNMAEKRRLNGRVLPPRFLLIHTLAHLLINQLTYECGYSSASLRERIYVSSHGEEAATAGLLIYTAAGDSEGTLGGLVRMGKPGRFEAIVDAAIAAARWCSSDPVCIDSAGQGPDSCNLAACHTCGLLPETSCEEFNRFLDRGLAVGTLSDPGIGFFNP
ncbi:DrmB family protein [Streptomyces sp. NPDC102381]|uniref:DrmB family protein n=1 Tax=Streptomyces sp. NPDC102381 TaxID=3366164 RepID=UPI003811C647